MKTIKINPADVDYWQLRDQHAPTQAGDGVATVEAGGHRYEVSITRLPAGRGFRYEIAAAHRVWQGVDGSYAEEVSTRMFVIKK